MIKKIKEIYYYLFRMIIILINDNNDYIVYSTCCFLKNKNSIYIVSWFERNEIIKIFDLKGEKIKYIQDSSEKLCSFHDKNLDKSFIINLKMKKLYSYDFNEGKSYKIYSEIKHPGKFFLHFHSIFVFNENNLTKLVAIGYGLIYIWDFYKGTILNKIYFDFTYSKIFCLWDNNNLLIIKNQNSESNAGKGDNSIFSVDLENGKISEKLINFKKFYLFFINKIPNHPVFGETLITFGFDYKLKFFKEKK